MSVAPPIARKDPLPSRVMTLPRMKLWTLKEYDRLFEAGILTERCELLEGVIVRKMGQNALHRVILHLIARWLAKIYGFDYITIQSPIEIACDRRRVSRPEPDVTVLHQPQTEFSKRHPKPENVRLVVEVADSTLEDDLDLKARIYGEGGVAEYWVVDVQSRQIWVHRLPSANGYQQVTKLAETQEIAAPDLPDAVIRVSEFFPKD